MVGIFQPLEKTKRSLNFHPFWAKHSLYVSCLAEKIFSTWMCFFKHLNFMHQKNPHIYKSCYMQSINQNMINWMKNSNKSNRNKSYYSLQLQHFSVLGNRYSRQFFQLFNLKKINLRNILTYRILKEELEKERYQTNLLVKNIGKRLNIST